MRIQSSAYPLPLGTPRPAPPPSPAAEPSPNLAVDSVELSQQALHGAQEAAKWVGRGLAYGLAATPSFVMGALPGLGILSHMLRGLLHEDPPFVSAAGMLANTVGQFAIVADASPTLKLAGYAGLALSGALCVYDDYYNLTHPR